MDIEGCPIQLLMEFLNHCPLEGEKLQLVSWVVGFSLAQALLAKAMTASVPSSLVWWRTAPKPVPQASV